MCIHDKVQIKAPSIFLTESRGITGRKMKFSIKDFFSKCDQIRRKLQILSHLLKKSLMENFIYYPEVYLGPCHTTIMELYAKTVSSEKTLFIFREKSPLYLFVQVLHIPLLPQKNNLAEDIRSS